MARILLVGDGPQYSTGYSVVIKNLAREFRKRGLEVCPAEGLSCPLPTPTEHILGCS